MDNRLRDTLDFERVAPAKAYQEKVLTLKREL